MSKLIHEMINVHRPGNENYNIRAISPGIGSHQDKFKKGFDHTLKEIVGDEPITSFASLVIFMEDYKDGLSYHHGENLAKHLTIMISHLYDESLCIYSLSIEDIYVVNNGKFIFLNHRHCQMITPAGYVVIQPGTHGTYSAPEFKELKTIDRAACNWCIGALLMNLLFNNTTASLDPIKYTSLYYFIKRCLDNNVELREVLFM